MAKKNKLTSLDNHIMDCYSTFGSDALALTLKSAQQRGGVEMLTERQLELFFRCLRVYQTLTAGSDDEEVSPGMQSGDNSK